MEKPTYQLNESSDGYWYEFDSVSNEKTIRKAIGYYKSKYDSDSVELSFGDLADGKLDIIEFTEQLSLNCTMRITMNSKSMG